MTRKKNIIPANEQPDLIDKIKKGSTKIAVLDVNFPKPVTFPTEWQKSETYDSEFRYTLGDIYVETPYPLLPSELLVDAILRFFGGTVQERLPKYVLCRWCHARMSVVVLEERLVFYGHNEEIYQDISVCDAEAGLYCTNCGYSKDYRTTTLSHELEWL